jgi:hypothetical protein
MAATALDAPVIWLPSLPGLYAITSSLGSNSSFTFNGADDKLAFVFQAMSTTPPDQVKFRCATHTSTGTIDVTLETVDATTGFPTGTPVTNSATGSVSVASTGTKTASGIQGTAALTVGAFYAVVLTAAAGFAGNFTVLRTTGTNGGTGSPYSLTKDSAGAWTKASTSNCGYAIGFFTAAGASIHMPGFAGAYTAAFQTFADATNPDERGNRFSLPVPATCYGAAVFCSLGATPADINNFTVSLFSGHTSGTPTLLASQAVDGDNQEANALRILMLDAPVSLSASTVYALALKATGTTGPALLRHSYAAAAELGCYLADSCYSTTRNNGSGAFTDTNTDVYAIYPILSAFDNGAGGGGGGMLQGNLRGNFQ